MGLKDDIKFLIVKQKSITTNLSIDIVLKNGNIVLRAFQLIQFDDKTETLKGLTQQEAYSFLRENRSPVYCKFNLAEIKEVTCREYASAQMTGEL